MSKGLLLCCLLLAGCGIRNSGSTTAMSKEILAGEDHPQGKTNIKGSLGKWDFVDLEGDLYHGEWGKYSGPLAEDSILAHIPSDRRTGVLIMWWDLTKSKPYRVCEFFKGVKHGYNCAFSYSDTGCRANVDTLRQGTYEKGVFFSSTRGVEEVQIFLDEDGHVGRYILFPEKDETERVPNNSNLLIKPRILTFTNNVDPVIHQKK